ncbi:MAG: A/G-specific adenine glycosylase [Planctomycetales bacterium]|nr:A/G-specific adenine glycosylase [Planctomycetales bacterium]
MATQHSRGEQNAENYVPDTTWNQQLRRRLLNWFDAHARDLPWRESRDPYKIWVSEIMLQQTQVETVRPYFKRFIERFPNVATLASSDEAEVLRLWEGLGYYRRARQLHKAARVVVDKHQGNFPTDYDEVLALPGIGRYTAGAILSIAHDQRVPIVEANTIRLYSRLLAYANDPRSTEGQKLLWDFAEHILPRKRTGDFNQAAMELGAKLCVPRQPQCHECPVAALCPTRQQGLQEEIPVAAKRVDLTDVTEVAVVVRRNNQILLRKCAEDERWAGLWDFPRFAVATDETKTLDASIVSNVQRLTGVTVATGPKLTTIKHGVTRYRITLECYAAKHFAGRLKKNSECEWTTTKQLEHYPLSVTGRKIAKLIAES